MESPLVSILVCSYNAEKFIELTLNSIVNQTYKNLEILILDNNSQDKTIQRIKYIQNKDNRIKFYPLNKNLGAYSGLNYLLNKAKGQYIAINDHDDLWLNNKIEKQINFLEKNKHYVGCGTAIINYYEKQKIFLLRQRPINDFVAWHTSVVFRNFGKLYNTSFHIANDFYFMKHILCQNQKKIHNFQEAYVLRKIRLDGQNLSTQWINLKNIKDIFRIDIGVIDKVSIINRMIIPQSWVDYLLIKLLLRNKVFNQEKLEKDKNLTPFSHYVIS
jgi:glycosyltransferase involved in cell wall biosynthesis